MAQQTIDVRVSRGDGLVKQLKAIALKAEGSENPTVKDFFSQIGKSDRTLSAFAERLGYDAKSRHHGKTYRPGDKIEIIDDGGILRFKHTRSDKSLVYQQVIEHNTKSGTPPRTTASSQTLASTFDTKHRHSTSHTDGIQWDGNTATITMPPNGQGVSWMLMTIAAHGGNEGNNKVREFFRELKTPAEFGNFAFNQLRYSQFVGQIHAGDRFKLTIRHDGKLDFDHWRAGKSIHSVQGISNQSDTRSSQAAPQLISPADPQVALPPVSSRGSQRPTLTEPTSLTPANTLRDKGVLSAHHPGVTDGVQTSRRVATLTFDICDAGHTIDDELMTWTKANPKIPVTFFISSRALDNNDTLQKQLKDLSKLPNVEFGNHGDQHVPLALGPMEDGHQHEVYKIKATTNREDLWRELAGASAKLKEITQKEPVAFRAGTAHYTPDAVRFIQQKFPNLVIAGFSSAPDGGGKLATVAVVRNMLSQVVRSLENGIAPIVLLHGKTNSAHPISPAVSEAVRQLQSEQVKFVSFSTLMQDGTKVSYARQGSPTPSA